MKEAGDKVSDEEKTAIEAAIKDLKEILKTGDKDTIEAKTKVLTEASQKMAERMYAQPGAEAGAAGAEQASGEEASGQEAKDEDVVDAEFEEVKDDEKQDDDKKEEEKK